MKKLLTCIMLLVVLCLAACLTGCGNVYLRGDALTAAETSAMDAYQVALRAGACPSCTAESLATQPAQSCIEPWLKGYLTENVRLM